MRLLRMMLVATVFAGSLAAAYGQVSGGVFGGSAGSSPSAQPAQPHMVRISSGVMQNLRLTSVQPIYPTDARENHIQGTVVLHAIIGKDGHIEKLEPISGPEELRTATMDAVSQWTYRPYLLNGEPTEVETTIVINFNLSPQANQTLPEGSRTTGIRIKGGISGGSLISINRVPPIYPPEAKPQE